MRYRLPFSISNGLNSVWIMIAALIIAFLPCKAGAQVFTPPQDISNTPTNMSFQQQIAVGPNGEIYVAWSDGTNSGTTSNFDILFTRSTDNGKTFSAPLDVSKNSGFAGFPDMVVDAHGGIDVFWEESYPAPPGLYFSHSTDGGVSFSAPTTISVGVTGPPRCVTDSGGGLDVVWYGSGSNGFQIFFARSTDGGNSFSAPVSVSGTAAYFPFNPKVGADSNGNIDVAWEDTTNGNLDIFFGHSTDGGNTFSSPVNLSNDTGTSTFPQMTVGPGGNVYVVWQDDTGSQYVPDILLARSTDGGNNFAVADLSNSSGPSVDPVVAISPTGTVDVAWLDATTSPYNIFFARSTDQGASFSTPTNISSNASGGGPRMSIGAQGNVNIVWDSGDVFFAQSADDGVTFSKPQNLSRDPGTSVQPTLAVDPRGNINVVWQDDTGLQFEAYDIFYSRGVPIFSFSSFVPKLDITVHGQAGFQFQASFALNSSSDGIFPVTEPLTLQIAGYTLVIPPGSFSLSSQGDFLFTGTINGAGVQARLSPTGAGTYLLQVQEQGSVLSSLVNPATVVLTIGNDMGTADVTAEFIN